MRVTITVVFAAAFTISGAAQDFMAPSGVPAVAFPKPDRPVADIVSPIWHDEKERDDADEPRQLVRLLGIKSGMTVADIGAGSGYYVVRLSPIVGSTAASSQKISCPNIYGACATGCAISDCRTLQSASVSRTIRGCQLIRSTLRSWCTCITRSHSLTPCSTISSPRSSLTRASALSTPSDRPPSMAPHQVSCAVSLLPSGIARSASIDSRAATPIWRSSRHPPLQAARGRKRWSRARRGSEKHFSPATPSRHSLLRGSSGARFQCKAWPLSARVSDMPAYVSVRAACFKAPPRSDAARTRSAWSSLLESLCAS